MSLKIFLRNKCGRVYWSEINITTIPGLKLGNNPYSVLWVPWQRILLFLLPRTRGLEPIWKSYNYLGRYDYDWLIKVHQFMITVISNIKWREWSDRYFWRRQRNVCSALRIVKLLLWLYPWKLGCIYFNYYFVEIITYSVVVVYVFVSRFYKQLNYGWRYYIHSVTIINFKHENMQIIFYNNNILVRTYCKNCGWLCAMTSHS